MNKITNVKDKLLVLGAVALAAAGMFIFSVPCPIKTLIGVPCLGCGMTRAVASALALDFASAWGYHKMFWSLPLLVLFFLWDGKPFKNSAVNVVILCLLSAGFVGNWVFQSFFL